MLLVYRAETYFMAIYNSLGKLRMTHENGESRQTQSEYLSLVQEQFEVGEFLE
jgi:hypothetical protein